MSSFLRFFREHLKRFLPLIAAGSLLLTLAGACQGILIATLRFVLGDSLSMGGPVDSTSLAVRAKVWIMSLLPDASHLKQETLLIPAFIVLMFMLKGVLTYSGTLLMVRSGIRATLTLRERLFSHLLRQEPAYFQRHPVGELLQRCISDVGAVQGIASNQFADAVRELTMALAMLGTIMVMNWRLSLTLFIAGPLVVLPIKKLSQRIRRINHRNMEASSRLLQRLKEVFSNIRVVLGFAREPFEEERFHQQNNELFRLMMKSARAQAVAHPIMELVGGLLLAGLLLYAATSIRERRHDRPGVPRLHHRRLRLLRSHPPAHQAQQRSAGGPGQPGPGLLGARPELPDAHDGGAGSGAGPAPAAGLRGRALRLRREERPERGAARDQPGGAQGRDRGPGGRLRRRQDHPGEPGAALLRPHQRAG